MTQFTPPPPGGPPGIAAPQLGAPLPVKPWSAAAITGFICSLLGCLGITAILGFIFGIVGVVRSSGGRKRGLGLAVAAIPISLFTGAMSFVLLGLVAAGFTIMPILVSLHPLMKADLPLSSESTAAFRASCSAGLNAGVTDEALGLWVQAVRAKHGRLAEEINLENSDFADLVGDESGTIVLPGRFVNGDAEIRVTLLSPSFWRLEVDDIEVGGLSLRSSAGVPIDTADQ